MNQHQIFQIPQLSVVDVAGEDAATIVNNLTTNRVTSLEVGQGNESFVTDVRGKILAHVLLFRVDNSVVRMIGPYGQSGRIAQHVDRYTIREDATPIVRDTEFIGLVLSPAVAGAFIEEPGDPPLLSRIPVSVAGVALDLYGCRWLGEGSGVLLVEGSDLQTISQTLCEQFKTKLGDQASFHAARTVARFPWFGIDLDETNLPQEADRDAVAISFHKGCYLGQETVARLDALGQVQKKLVAWSIEGGVPLPGTALQAGDKTVGRLTSVTALDQGGAIAIGPARRSHFEPGSVAKGMLEPGDTELTATVV